MKGRKIHLYSVSQYRPDIIFGFLGPDLLNLLGNSSRIIALKMFDSVLIVEWKTLDVVFIHFPIVIRIVDAKILG